MKNALEFDFNINKETLTTTVHRQFDAGLKLVWDAFTKQELLDQWWAPKPYLSKTKHMNFTVGGRRFYAMVGPAGEEHWGIQDYKAIHPTKSFKYFDVFADKDENINQDDPGSEWTLNFNESKGITTVDIHIQSKTLADLENTIQMGFKEGFTMTLDSLSEMLTAQK